MLLFVPFQDGGNVLGYLLGCPLDGFTTFEISKYNLLKMKLAKKLYRRYIVAWQHPFPGNHRMELLFGPFSKLKAG